MALFYDRLWRQGKPPIEALREAQLDALPPSRAGRQARGGTRDAGLRQAGAASRAGAGFGRLVGTSACPGAAVGGVCAVGLRTVSKRLGISYKQMLQSGVEGP